MLSARPAMTNPQAYALLALVTAIWAGNFPLAKAGLAEPGPLTLTATRALVTAPAPLALAERPRGPRCPARAGRGGGPCSTRSPWASRSAGTT
jgi:drug/metabolite transporter (DMT)-like permease